MNFTDPITFFTVLITTNITAYILTIIISKLWNKIFHYEENLSKKEVIDSVLILFINIAISVPGFVLYHKGIIVFSDAGIWISFLGIFVLMDFLMYVLHYLSHDISFLKKIHSIHHEHKDKFNCVSLYHMSPWEAALFGLLLTSVAFLFHFNIYGFILFLIFNWLYGVITHLNGSTYSPFLFIFTTNTFHKIHHNVNNKNYGFYTFFWDKLFRTEIKCRTKKTFTSKAYK